MHESPRIILLAGLWATLIAPTARAEPWATVGDVALRHDVQLLADAGVLTSPVTAWPLAWGALARDLRRAGDIGRLTPAAAAAYSRMVKRAELATASGGPRVSFSAAAAEQPRALRTFENTPRESGEIAAALGWTGERFAYRLQAAAAADPADDRGFRLDGSYAGMVIGNVMISAGAVDRWWGPGWDGSLVLSNNARPFPALTIERNFADPFEHPWLRWIGPWTARAIFGELGSDRAVPDARFFGLRVGFRPLRDLEFGLSRSAQWCGEGRPCDLGTFADLLLGTKDNQLDPENEPGNQLAGVDFRWVSPLSDAPYAVYGQFIGEDEAGGLPSRYLGQFGIEWWGESPLGMLPGSLRLRAEFNDSAAGFYGSPPFFDFAYNHFIYKTGYRYLGRSIGHAMDNDGRMISIGALLVTERGRTWNLLLRSVELNRGGDPDDRNTVSATPKDLVNIEFTHQRATRFGTFDLGLGYDRTDDDLAGESSSDVRAFVRWSWQPGAAEGS